MHPLLIKLGVTEAIKFFVRRRRMKIIKNAKVRSLVRSGLKIVGTAAVSWGLVSAGDVDVAVTALADIGGGLSVLWGLWLSNKDKS